MGFHHLRYKVSLKYSENLCAYGTRLNGYTGSLCSSGSTALKYSENRQDSVMEIIPWPQDYFQERKTETKTFAVDTVCQCI